jgi:hypothetical protein
MCIRYTAEVLARLIVSKKNQHQASFPIQFSNTVPENAIKQCKVQVNTLLASPGNLPSFLCLIYGVHSCYFPAYYILYQISVPSPE